jgi:phosphoribosylglycinamide formyltransferase-1
MDIAVLFSGRGSNMKAIIERSLKEDSRYSVKVVVTDNPVAPGIQIAHDFSKPCVVVGKKNWEWHTYDALNYYGVRFVALAGFMRILPTLFCMRWKTRCINIHPSLLPKYKGLHTHRRVLESDDKEHGCSIHFVTPELDAGPIIAQARVPIFNKDNEDGLAARVLQQENLLYPEVLQNIAINRIGTDGEVIWFKRKPIEEPLTLHDLTVDDIRNPPFHHSV